jgi:hypothetical protein
MRDAKKCAISLHTGLGAVPPDKQIQLFTTVFLDIWVILWKLFHAISRNFLRRNRFGS